MNRDTALVRCFVYSIALFTGTAFADTVSVTLENDTIAGTDKHYTNGIRFGWLSDKLKSDTACDFEKSYGAFMRTAVESIPFVTLSDQKNHNVGIGLYQRMFTPEDISKTEPDYNDMPYAGHLVASFFFIEWDDENYDEYRVQLGIIGPASGAEKIQKYVHKLTGNTEPMGWDNQLGNHLTVGIAYDHGVKSWSGSYDNGLESDWINSFGFQLDNFYTGGFCATAWRMGMNYPKTFNVYHPGMMGDSALLGMPRDNNRIGWSITAGLFVKGIAYLYLIDAAKEYSIKKNAFLGNAVASFSLYIENFQIAFTMQTNSSLVRDSKERLSLGAVSALWYF